MQPATTGCLNDMPSFTRMPEKSCRIIFHARRQEQSLHFKGRLHEVSSSESLNRRCDESIETWMSSGFGRGRATKKPKIASRPANTPVPRREDKDGCHKPAYWRGTPAPDNYSYQQVRLLHLSKQKCCCRGIRQCARSQPRRCGERWVLRECTDYRHKGGSSDLYLR